MFYNLLVGLERNGLPDEKFEKNTTCPPFKKQCKIQTMRNVVKNI